YLKAKIIVVFLFAVFPVLINTYQGVRECDKNMLEVAYSFRSSEWRVWQGRLLPFALPSIISGVHLHLGGGLHGTTPIAIFATLSCVACWVRQCATWLWMERTFARVFCLMVLGVSLT